MKSPRNHPGEVFGSWTLVEYVAGGKSPRVKAKWVCRCSCGMQRAVRSDHLQRGMSQSCGHDQPEKMAEAMRNYHRHIERQREPVSEAPAASPWAVLKRYEQPARSAA